LSHKRDKQLEILLQVHTVFGEQTAGDARKSKDSESYDSYGNVACYRLNYEKYV